jgi:hypothetical protein
MTALRLPWDPRLPCAGYAIVDGITVPITGCELRDSKIWFFARIQGPLRSASGPVTIFGSDNKGVCQGGDVFWPAVRGSDSLLLKIEMLMGECE